MRWRPVDYIVGLLAVILLLVFMAPVTRSILHGMPLTESALDVLSDLTMGLMSVVSMYVGASIQRKRDESEDR